MPTPLESTHTTSQGTDPATFQSDLREKSVRSKTQKSLECFRRSSASLASGVSSGLRRTARPYPLFFNCGQGSSITDVDGNTYRDYTAAWGPLILGHSPPAVTAAIAAQLPRGLTFGAQHALEYEVAEQLTGIIPCADSVCFASTGTEIVQVALRLARAATGRHKYLKFEGHYHGWADSVLVSYHPSLEQIEAAHGGAVGTGTGQLATASAIVAQWNERQSVEQAFDENPNEISAVICEPILCNSGCIPPEPGFLEFLRDISSRFGALLIFDEVITGFRVRLGGAQERYGVTPDLATYAKAVAGGAPLSVLAGKQRYMDLIASGQVIHAGTMNGNPLSLAAAKATLEILSADSERIYSGLQRRGDLLRQGIQTILSASGLPVVTNGDGPVFQISFAPHRPRTYRDTLLADTALYSDFVLALLDEGILALPDGRWYLSVAHTDADVEQTLAAVQRTVRQ